MTLWTAEQLAFLPDTFSMTATYSRNNLETGIYQFDFNVQK